jgi:hypothetical protein
MRFLRGLKVPQKRAKSGPFLRKYQKMRLLGTQKGSENDPLHENDPFFVSFHIPTAGVGYFIKLHVYHCFRKKVRIL